MVCAIEKGKHRVGDCVNLAAPGGGFADSRDEHQGCRLNVPCMRNDNVVKGCMLLAEAGEAYP